MADSPSQNQNDREEKSATSQTPPDLYSFLIRMIDTASKDPAQLRKLVYAIVWQCLKPEGGGARQPIEPRQPLTINELQQELEFESVIERVEANADVTLSQHPEVLVEQTTETVTQTQSVDNALVVLPQRAPEILLPADGFPPRVPAWLNHRVHLSVEMSHAAQDERSYRTGLLPFLQLVAASVIGVALYVGVTTWMQSGSGPVFHTSSPTATPGPAQTQSSSSLQRPRNQQSPTQPGATDNVFPFPLPKTYGVYAGSEGQLTELTALPIKIPDPRVRLSAPINTPSETVVAGNKLTFVVFRRDLVNNAPATVSVRVVARVARELKFVDGKPVTTAIQGPWRISMKSYDFKVAPLEGHPEMVVIRPDASFAFPAGRYALVLNGLGYDFTVPGPITSADQCLEQSEMLNGTVLSECAKS